MMTDCALFGELACDTILVARPRVVDNQPRENLPGSQMRLDAGKTVQMRIRVAPCPRKGGGKTDGQEVKRGVICTRLSLGQPVKIRQPSPYSPNDQARPTAAKAQVDRAEMYQMVNKRKSESWAAVAVERVVSHPAEFVK